MKREIFAADFRDRVVHHLIAHRLVPLLEEKFIDDSYSTRKGKGTLYGIERVEEHIRLCSENYTRDCYILKIDIRSFFMKISKRRLYDLTEELLHERYGGNDLAILLYLLRETIFNRPEKNCIRKTPPQSSYLIIQKHLKRDSLLRKKMEGVIDRNNELLETRKNVILTISHDIRGPLNIIYGYVELAKDTRDRKRRNHHLENIETECKHILHLLNNLLDVYRLNESKETCNNVPFNLNDLLERIVTGFSHIANNKGIIFHHDSQNTDVVLCGDMDRISQIIDNLLTNAVKFTNAGMIQFNVRYENGMLYIEIKDTGIGMDQDTVSRIFRPFERLSSEANAEGFGLGLPITKGLVKLLGGSIDVESKIGHGSTFRVSLPLAVSNEKINSEASAVPQDRLPLPQRVLVIDNDTLQLEIAKEMLERNGVSCTTCSNAKELVNEMRRQDYDLLLSDIQMPETNGFEILALLRKSSIGNSHTIPIVAMTARGEGEKEAFIKGGFTDSIHKPFSMRELLDMVSSVVSRDVEESHTPDFATFTADVLDKRELLRTFIIQSEQNMADLQSAIKTGDIEKLHDIAHEIKPSLELLRADAPLVKLRTTLNDSACDMNTVNEQVKLLIGHISGLITEAEKEIKKMSDETEGTDS